MPQSWLKLLVIVAVLCGCQVLCQYDDYSLGYDDLYDQLPQADELYQQDAYGYYGDDEAEYYDYYGFYEEKQNYDDYYAYDEYRDDLLDDCVLDKEGRPMVKNGTIMCDIKLTGGDKAAKSLKGGVDGVYRLVNCHHGKPLYKRMNSPAGEERTLWYSYAFGDWDISRGSEPNEGDILMYGDEGIDAVLPVAVQNWSLLTAAQAGNRSGGKYKAVDLKLNCADGTPITLRPQATVEKPKMMLTFEEMDTKFKQIYDQAPRHADPSLNFAVVVLMVMTGLTFVLAIPYLLLRKKRRGTGNSFSGSLAQALMASKKQKIGRTV